MKRTILQEPDPRLSIIAQQVDLSDPMLVSWATDLRYSVGTDLGLAATQLGIDARIIVARIPVLTVCVNPEWRPTGARRPGWEKCLSVVAGGRYKIFRNISIDASWTRLDGTRVAERLEGNNAIVFQHECDHLDGITINRK